MMVGKLTCAVAWLPVAMVVGFANADVAVRVDVVYASRVRVTVVGSGPAGTSRVR